MKSFKGSSLNFSQPILGRITKTTKRHSWLKKGKPEILIIHDPLQPIARAAGYLVQSDLNRISLPNAPIIKNIQREHLQELNQGDVIRMTPAGEVLVLYENNSPHNVILATNRCNLNCIMCPQPPNRDPNNIIEDNLMLIRLMDPKSTPTLAITGGEPTLLDEG